LLFCLKKNYTENVQILTVVSLKAALMLILTNLNFLSIVNVSNEKATAKSNSSCGDGKHVLEEKGAASDASSP
jgi:hypothetical protein